VIRHSLVWDPLVESLIHGFLLVVGHPYRKALAARLSCPRAFLAAVESQFPCPKPNFNVHRSSNWTRNLGQDSRSSQTPWGIRTTDAGPTTKHEPRAQVSVKGGRSAYAVFRSAVGAHNSARRALSTSRFWSVLIARTALTSIRSSGYIPPAARVKTMAIQPSMVRRQLSPSRCLPQS
jgi:hypothetical protein